VVQDRVRLAKDRLDREQNVAEKPQEQAAPQTQPEAKPDPKAEDWANKNNWFGADEVMTYAAFGIHKKLIEEEGFDPQSDEYYTAIDSRIRSEFPHKFETAKKTGGGSQVASANSSASRSTKQGRRSVKLSHSQVAIAKKLGVPLEEYAKYVKE
jgi:GH15 family glucan-1,4-alpha-glucosidase